MGEPEKLHGPLDLARLSCDPLEPSNQRDYSSSLGSTSEKNEPDSYKMSPQNDRDDGKVGAISKIPKVTQYSRNSVDARQQRTFQSGSAYNSITPAQRREREAKASRHVAFNTTILCPLSNLGNTCYFNSGIQILSNCPAFVFGLRDAPHCYTACRKSMHLLSRPSRTSKHSLFQLLANLLYDMEYASIESGRAISPSHVLNQLAEVFSSFEGRRQQDCPEMINAVLDTVEEENRLDIEVNELLQSFEASAQAYKAGESLPICNSTHVVNEKLIASAEPFPSSNNALPEQVNSSSACSSEALPGPRSAHIIAMLRLMQKVNEENCELEKKAAERKGKTFDPRNSFIPPRLVFNPTTGGFKGYMVSEIRCHNCFSVSRVVDSFSSLILEIPSQRQRYEFAKRNPNIKRVDAYGNPLQLQKRPDISWWNPMSHLYHFYKRFYDFFFSCFSTINYALSLEECLDIHFDPVELKGGNKYRCESCGGLHEATKSEFLLSLPEYLFIQMKRFKMNIFTKGKKSDPVIFPVSWTPFKEGTEWEEFQKTRQEVLDLRPYMHSTVAANIQPIQPWLHRNGVSQDDDAKFLAPSESQQIPSTYTLEGIVNHHGSITSGHYTVFTHKKLNNKDMWLYINDEEIEPVSLSNVADSEEYLLLYHCQPIMGPTEEFLRLRDKARYYLLGARKSLQNSDMDVENTKRNSNHARDPHYDAEAGGEVGEDGVVYISCMWLQRAAFFHDPGPIINKLSYRSSEHYVKMAKQIKISTADSRVSEALHHAYGLPVKWYYVEIEEDDYRAFYEAFGGDAPVTRSQYVALKRDQEIIANLFLKKT